MIRFSRNISFKELLSVKLAISFFTTIIISFNIVLLQYPLTNVLGYEFSALNSLLNTIIIGLFTIKWIKKNPTFSGSFFLIATLFVLIPLLISVISSLITGFCSFWDGISFYFIITVPSSLVGFVLGIFVSYLTDKFRILLFFLLILIIAFIPVLEIYFYPQIYFFNPLVAYFPGSIYDEGMTVELKLIVYRLINIIYASIILLLIIKDEKKNKRLRNSLLIATIALIFFFTSPFIGFSTDYSRLDNLLSEKLVTENFQLHLPKNISKKESNLIALHSQYYYESLQKSVDETPEKRIEIFIFENSDQKKNYFGSGAADVAKPWLYQIYLSRESWSSTLKHELAHVFSAEFGSTIFKLSDSFNPFMIEGFATSQDPFRDELHIDYLSALANTEIDASTMDHILTGFNFFTSNSFLTYTYAGSFSKFLIDQYGIEKYKLLYSSLDFIKTYALSSEEIIKKYSKYLKEFPIEINECRFNYYFGRQSIVQKVCPRFIGNMLRKGWEQVRNNELDKAKLSFRVILAKAQNYSAIVGLTYCLEKQDSIYQSIKLLEQSLSSFNKTPYYYLLSFRLADLYAKTSQLSKASKLYVQLNQQKPSINLDIISSLRIKLLEVNILEKYLAANDSVKYQILTGLNRDKYYFPSYPTMISLSNSIGEDYQDFIKQFDKTNFITDFYSAYAVYCLSNYMLMNFDFRNARKMAALAKRFREQNHISLLFQENFEKAEWFYYYADEFLQQFNPD